MRSHRFLSAGCASAALTIAILVPVSAAAATKPSAPVIHEKFTLLSCPHKPRTTLQIEGCAEHRVVATDATIDALNAKVFARLGASGRAQFVVTNADWVRYRDAACAVQASIYSGGSVQPVAFADCLVSIDVSHVTELSTMLKALSPAG